MSNDQITISIDGKEIVTSTGKTIYQAARDAGIEIPALCYSDKCKPNTTCMVCLVKVHGRAGYAPSCATMVTHEMQIDSETEEVIHLRRKALEMLLSEHLGDCLGPCQVACPAGLDIPNMLRAIARGDMEDAGEIVRQTITIPMILAAICPAPCEKICRHKQIGEPIPICRLKGEAGSYAVEKMELPKPAADTGKSVAIVGAGPAGLSAAWHIRLAGHDVDVYDKHAKPGGGMLEIAPNKLAVEVLDAEAKLPFEMGCKLIQSELGSDISLAELAKKYDAVLLATGPKSDEKFADWGMAGDTEKITVDKHTLQVAGSDKFANVFAAGGVNQAGRMAVRAVGQGRAAAVSISQMLAGDAVCGPGEPFNTRIGRFASDELVRIAELRDKLEVNNTADAKGPAAGDCLHCDCRDAADCKLRKYSDMLGANPKAYKHAERKEYEVDYAEGNKLIYESGKCIKCGICVQLTGSANPDKALTFSQRGYDTAVVAPFGMKLDDLDDGLVAELVDSCPTGALARPCLD